jgi:hypothetical protein
MIATLKRQKYMVEASLRAVGDSTSTISIESAEYGYVKANNYSPQAYGMHVNAFLRG